MEFTEDMGPADKDTGKGGIHPKSVRDVLYRSCAGCTNIRVGDVGDDPPHGPGPRGGYNKGYPAGSLGGNQIVR